MADLTITAANVSAGSDCKQVILTAGVAITQGMCLFRNPVDGRAYKSVSNDLTASRAEYIALGPGVIGQPFVGALLDIGGNINLGATLAVGKVYAVSSNAGAIRPIDDVVASDYITVIGIATTTSNLVIRINYGGVQTAGDVT